MKKWFIIRNIVALFDYIYHHVLGFPVADEEDLKKEGDEE
jgi:hypothetical protein